MKKFLTIAENFFVVLSLTFFTGGLTVLVPYSMLTLIRYFIWVTVGIVICIQWKKSLFLVSRNILLCILTLIILLSFIWSLSPVFTLKDLREVLQMTMFALYFAMRFNFKEQVKLIAWTFTIGILLSLFFALVIPSTGIHGADHPGAWKGIYDYKNTFGSMMVLSSLAFFLLPAEKPTYHLYKWTGFGASLVMMVLSTSKSSLVISLFLIFMVWAYRNFQWQGKLSIVYVNIAVLIIGCLATVGLTEWVSIVTGLGKDPTLTGRTIIWDVALTKLQESPLLGFGRGAFWAPGSKYAIAAGRAVAVGFIPPHAHNGFIDLALDVGLIGLLLFLINFALTYFRALNKAYAAKNPEDAWPLAFLMFLAMNNMTESYLLRLSNIYWVLYITIALSLSQRRQS